MYNPIKVMGLKINIQSLSCTQGILEQEFNKLAKQYEVLSDGDNSNDKLQKLEQTFEFISELLLEKESELKAYLLENPEPENNSSNTSSNYNGYELTSGPWVIY